MGHEEKLAAYTGAFVDELARSGTDRVVICPGSRSTPLAVSFTKHPEIKVWMHVDERSAGYFALGMAKTSGAPVALLCSSGTAAANFYPAVVEAHEACVPLIVLTADRPHELRDVGAPQAIDQIRLYGDYVKWFVEMAPPADDPRMLRYVRTTAVRTQATAEATPCGPVHLNFPFREPLMPATTAQLWQAGREDEVGYVHVQSGRQRVDEGVVEKLATELSDVERGLIVCGPQGSPKLPALLSRLGQKWHYPILADPLSGLRSGKHDQNRVIDGYDAFLRDPQVTEAFEPEVILRFGAMPVSKPYLRFVEKHPDARQVIVDDNGWREPTQLASDMIQTDPVSFCEALLAYTGEQGENEKKNTWNQAWLDINAATQQQVGSLTRQGGLTEGRIFYELATDLLPQGAGLFVGNSMPVRDLDTFFMNNDRGIQTLANRGANGIDGVISTALGASTEIDPLVLVIGDLSFYHDMNGLLAAKRHQLNVTLILINNNGGGIFSFLPQANEAEKFEELFGTPTDLDFEKAVMLYGGAYHTVSDVDDFREQVMGCLRSGELDVIEVTTERDHNTYWHRMVWNNVSKAAEALLGEKETF